MSASERLAALDERWNKNVGLFDKGRDVVGRALPEIVAVVRAAEGVSAIERTGVLPDFMPLAAALAALDARLGGE